MSEIDKEIIEIDGFEREGWPSALFVIPKTKKYLASRFVKPPLEATVPPPETTSVWLFLVATVTALVIAVFVTYRDVSTDAWSICYTSRGLRSYGSHCHYRYIATIATLSFFAALFISTLRATSKTTKIIAQNAGPHLRLTSDSFWCDGMVEPLMFSDVTDVDFFYRNYLFRDISCVTFYANKPIKLANGVGPLLVKQSGKKPGISITSNMFGPEVHSVLHAAYCLAKRYQKDHPTMVTQ